MSEDGVKVLPAASAKLAQRASVYAGNTTRELFSNLERIVERSAPSEEQVQEMVVAVQAAVARGFADGYLIACQEMTESARRGRK